MRARLVSGCVVVLLAACGGADDGALLSIRATNGPVSASRLEIVLANVAASSVTLVDDQRVAPGDLATGVARYYRQRETGGELDNIARLDGFSVRIAPNAERVPDEEFVPFVLAYNGDALRGIGFVKGPDGEPAPITIRAGQRDTYEVELVAVGDGDPGAALAAGQQLTLSCSDAASGVAWQRAGELDQLRLLFPVANEFDATTRAADLDCDEHPATDSDCDDLRASYHADAIEACDGADSNCDGVRYTVARCDSTCGPMTGAQLCDDVDGMQTQCLPDAQCRCTSGTAGCFQCTLEHVGAAINDRTPCAPAESKTFIPGCGPSACDVAVIPTMDTRWKFSLSTTGEPGTFARQATTVSGVLHVQAEYLDTALLDAQMLELSTIHLSVTQNAASRYHAIALRLAPNTNDTECPTVQGNNLHPMSCTNGN